MCETLVGFILVVLFVFLCQLLRVIPVRVDDGVPLPLHLKGKVGRLGLGVGYLGSVSDRVSEETERIPSSSLNWT